MARGTTNLIKHGTAEGFVIIKSCCIVSFSQEPASSMCSPSTTSGHGVGRACSWSPVPVPQHSWSSSEEKQLHPEQPEPALPTVRVVQPWKITQLTSILLPVSILSGLLTLQHVLLLTQSIWRGGGTLAGASHYSCSRKHHPESGGVTGNTSSTQLVVPFVLLPSLPQHPEQG